MKNEIIAGWHLYIWFQDIRSKPSLDNILVVSQKKYVFISKIFIDSSSTYRHNIFIFLPLLSSFAWIRYFPWLSTKFNYIDYIIKYISYSKSPRHYGHLYAIYLHWLIALTLLHYSNSYAINIVNALFQRKQAWLYSSKTKWAYLLLNKVVYLYLYL